MDRNKRNSKNLKYYFIIVLFLITNTLLFADDVLGPGGIKLGENDKVIDEKKYIELSLILSYQKILDEYGYELGGRLNIHNNGLNYGFSLFSLLTHTIKIEDPEYLNPALFRLTYGGLNFAYSLNIFNDLNITPGILIGLGNINASLSTDVDINLKPADYWVFLFQPGIRMNYNLFKDINIGTELYYRFALGATLPGTNNCKLSGIGLSIFISSKQFM